MPGHFCKYLSMTGYADVGSHSVLEHVQTLLQAGPGWRPKKYTTYVICMPSNTFHVTSSFGMPYLGLCIEICCLPKLYFLYCCMCMQDVFFPVYPNVVMYYPMVVL